VHSKKARELREAGHESQEFGDSQDEALRQGEAAVSVSGRCVCGRSTNREVELPAVPPAHRTREDESMPAPTSGVLQRQVAAAVHQARAGVGRKKGL